MKDYEIGRDVGQQPRRAGDLLGHLRQRPLPLAGDAGARDMHAETGRGEVIELRLAHAVDGRDDHSDPRPWGGQRIGDLSLDRDGIHAKTSVTARYCTFRPALRASGAQNAYSSAMNCCTAATSRSLVSRASFWK